MSLVPEQTKLRATSRPIESPKRLNERAIAWLLRIATFIVFAGLWQIYGSQSENPMMASFTETVRGFWELTVVTGELWQPLLITNQAMVIGYLLAVVTAIPLGLAAGRSKTLDRMADPYVAIFNAVPIAPLIPVVIIALGLGLPSRVLIVYFFAFVFMAVNTRAGVRKVDRTLPEMATSFGANETEVWRLVVVPGALPSIFAGLRIGLGRAIAGMVIVELLLVASGIGRILLRTSGRLQGDLVFGIVMAIVLESLILLAAMRMLERKLTPWAHDASV